MSEQDSGQPKGQDVAAIDALYRPFPEFASWPRLGSSLRDLWARFATELNDQKRTAAPDQFARAVTVAVRAAAIDTGAIEGLYQVDRGFTMSVALQTFAWELAIGERGEGVRQLFEAQLAGYELAIDAVTGRVPLSEAWLRSLHEQICAPQTTYRVLTKMGPQDQALPKGRYKEHPNHVRLPDGSYHSYSPVAAVAPEMHRLLEQLRNPAFEEAHPVEQTAYAHYALTSVHAFADGNGRVARALASVYLYKNLSIPLVIYANQRIAYFDALAAADAGDPGPWLDFVANRGLDTMQLVEQSLRAAAITRPDEIAESLAALASPHARLQNLALRLLDQVQDRWGRAAGTVVPRVALFSQRDPLNHQPPTAGYRTGASQGFTVQTALPIPFEATITFRVNVAADDANPFHFQLEALPSQDVLDVREEDLTPEFTARLSQLLDLWVKRQLGALLVELQQRARTELSGHPRP
ncbi:MAG TPA: Fic family protein [Thermoanaerobaculia bacterium]|nr:Fic family protein [Thermoanaerobaculia bacterium]